MANLMAFICSVQLLFLIPHVEADSEHEKFLEFTVKCKADVKKPWSYSGNNGPLLWAARFPGCNGQKQSPIEIITQDVVEKEDLEKLNFLNYDIPLRKGTIENDGNTIKVTPTDKVQRSIQVDDDTYRLDCLKFHWGDAYDHGSEHTIDGMRYSLEMHLFHRNDDNNLAIVGVFFQEQTHATSELYNMTKRFPKLLYKDTSKKLKSHLDLSKLIAYNPSSFYRYEGSLTTPECTECVTWSLLPEVLPIGTEEMVEFRKLYSTTQADAQNDCKISNNYRHLQAMNGRTVFRSQ